MPVPMSARVVSECRQHRLRMLIDRLMCRDGELEELLLERSPVKSLAARRISLAAVGTCLKYVMERVLLLVGNIENDGALVAYSRNCFAGSSASPWFAASCCCDGSLAVIRPLWVQKTAEVPSMFEGVAAPPTCAHTTNSAGTRKGRNCSTPHPSQSSQHGSVHFHLAGDVHSPVRVVGVEKEGSCPTACDTAPMLVGKGPGWVGPCETTLASLSQQAHGHVTTSEWRPHRSGARFQNFARGAKTRSVESVHCRKMRQKPSSSSRLQLSRSPAPKQVGNTRATCRGIVDREIPAVHKRMTGKYMLDVFGGPGFLATASNLLGLCGHALDTKFGARYDVTIALVLNRVRQDVSAGKCVAAMIISLPRLLTSCSSQVISASASTANLLHRARVPWILEHM